MTSLICRYSFFLLLFRFTNSFYSPRSQLITPCLSNRKYLSNFNIYQELDEKTKSKILQKMLNKPDPKPFAKAQIEDYIIKFKVSLLKPDIETGLLPLRLAVRSGYCQKKIYVYI